MKETVLRDGDPKTVWGMDMKSMAPWFVDETMAELHLRGEGDLAPQMERLWIFKDSQSSKLRLNGGHKKMSFPVRPLPFPSIEELRNIWPLLDERKVSINLRGGNVCFSLDGFGCVEWIRTDHLPDLYVDLSKYFDFRDGEEMKPD